MMVFFKPLYVLLALTMTPLAFGQTSTFVCPEQATYDAEAQRYVGQANDLNWHQAKSHQQLGDNVTLPFYFAEARDRTTLIDGGESFQSESKVAVVCVYKADDDIKAIKLVPRPLKEFAIPDTNTSGWMLDHMSIDSSYICPKHHRTSCTFQSLQ